MTKPSEDDVIGTIHDAKTEIIEFFRVKDKTRVNEDEVKMWQNKRKAAMAFNKIVRNARERTEDAKWAGVKVKTNEEILNNSRKIELDVPRWVRDALQNDYFIFKFKEFYLREIPYGRINNKIKYHQGSNDFYFIVNTGFKRHKLSYEHLKKLSVKSEENLAEFLIKIFKKDVDDFEEKDKKILSREALKRKKKVYEKLNKVVSHNLSISTMDDYSKPLTKRDDGGKLVKDEGEYPMNFTMHDEELIIYIP